MCPRIDAPAASYETRQGETEPRSSPEQLGTGYQPWGSGDSRSFSWGHILEQMSCKGPTVLFWAPSHEGLSQPGTEMLLW